VKRDFIIRKTPDFTIRNAEGMLMGKRFDRYHFYIIAEQQRKVVEPRGYEG